MHPRKRLTDRKIKQKLKIEEFNRKREIVVSQSGCEMVQSKISSYIMLLFPGIIRQKSGQFG